MKKLLLIFASTTLAFSASGQVYKEYDVDKSASFPGGEMALYTFLQDSLRYPNEAIQNNVKGSVFVELTIDKTGNITQVKPIKGIGNGCDEEAVRLVKAMPRWQPAQKGNKSVAMLYNLRILFLPPEKK
ncbi:hypothetical protein GCM10023189_36200 [Nibrella saemangeumensis]|uniref:TonB C-terminal domain-containing protein n=1 Tax=Nibrella saemangeumensis TaxID=1084526 RepID=A0ABP8N7T0_9BACT